MSLKELTKDLHHEAETTKFAKLLLSGKIEREDYAKYLHNLIYIYDAIEQQCHKLGIFNNMPSLPRTQQIREDFIEINDGRHIALTKATLEYLCYLYDLEKDPNRKHLIKAHLYCRHMGDLFGGQIIRKQVAHISKGRFYEFNNAEELKAAIRRELTDDLGDEARVAFTFAIKMMRDLYNGE